MHERIWTAVITLMVALASTSLILRGDQAATPEPPLLWQFSAGG